MINHRYILEPYKGMSTRHLCPGCNSRNKTFSRYIDRETGQHVDPSVGRCNRESNCCYHYTPSQYFKDNDILIETSRQKETLHILIPKREPSFISGEIMRQTLKGYYANNFVTFLLTRFGEEVATQLIEKYSIGTSKHWPGSTIFWQIDSRGKIRTGKIMLYDAITGKRIKEPFSHIAWAHTLLNYTEYELEQCLFGAHLLADVNLHVAIVESEKTAIICSQYLPQFIWLAVGGLANLNIDKCRILMGRKVILFPDLNGFEKWSDKAKELRDRMPGTSIEVSGLLETYGSEDERASGLDIADYLLRYDWRAFRKETIPPSAGRIEEDSKSENCENCEPSENIIICPDPTQEIYVSIMEIPHWLNHIRLLVSCEIWDNSADLDSINF